MVQTPEDDGCSSRHFASSSRTLGALAALQGPSASSCPALAPGDVFPTQSTQHSLEKICVYPCSWKTSQLPPGLQAQDMVLCPSSRARPSWARCRSSG